MIHVSQFLLLLLAVGASLGQCPPREDILPCSCRVSARKWEKYNITVSCQKVDDVDDVRRALQSVKGIQGVAVNFENSRLESVPSDLFKGLHVTHVYFMNCVLEKFGDVGRSALEGLEDIVQSFRIQYSFTEDNPLKFVNVSRLNALTYLHVGGNNMEELDDEWFAEGPANLLEVVADSNRITRLGDRAFNQLKNVREISLSKNEIETLTRSMFPSPAVYLEEIQLADNKISSFPVEIFSDMPALKNVFLERNSLKSIPEVTWKPVWSKLKYLDLDGNPLNCAEDVEWTFKEIRPKNLQGKCVSPDERRGKNLKKIIDDNKKNK